MNEKVVAYSLPRRFFKKTTFKKISIKWIGISIYYCTFYPYILITVLKFTEYCSRNPFQIHILFPWYHKLGWGLKNAMQNIIYISREDMNYDHSLSYIWIKCKIFIIQHTPKKINCVCKHWFPYGFQYYKYKSTKKLDFYIKLVSQTISKEK